MQNCVFYIAHIFIAEVNIHFILTLLHLSVLLFESISADAIVLRSQKLINNFFAYIMIFFAIVLNLMNHLTVGILVHWMNWMCSVSSVIFI